MEASISPISTRSSFFALLLCCLFAAATGAGAKDSRGPEFVEVELTEEEAAKGLSPQVRQSSGWFTFGSTIADEVDGEAEAYTALEREEQKTGQKLHRRDGNRAATWARIKPFAIDKYAVSNTQFQKFVRATGHRTEAETFQWSFVLEHLATEDVVKEVDGREGFGRVKDARHWMAVKGAYWRRPEGPGSSLRGRGNHPVLHVSYNDSKAYCAWAEGRRLPTEKEWEYAARGGLEDEPFPWGAAARADKCNGWTGEFPSENNLLDGYAGTAPVNAFEPNGYGLYNMVGNVWEWTEGRSDKEKPIRGGSYIDTVDGSANHALRVSSRQMVSPDSGGGNSGFRCASGDALNTDQREIAIEGIDTSADGMSQEKLQQVIAEGGVEGLTAYLATQGQSNAKVLTPDEIRKRQANGESILTGEEL
jgi:sulfatase modifying factor 1